jgi:YVTN family beta-propeller protein
MDFRILGPLEVTDQGRTLPIKGRKPQALLALLLLNAGEVVSRERLIDELWGDDPPPTASKTLQVHVSRLRRELGDAVVTRGGGYLIHVEPGELDLERFTRLVDEGRRAMAAGEPGPAEERLREALELWRGPPFAQLGDDAFARIEGERLADLRLDAVEERIEAELALGRQSEVIGELEALVARHPYRERPRAQLMLALYREGRQAEALDAYRDARSVLVEGLGIEPGPRLREMHSAILAQDPALDGVRPTPARAAPPAAARPPPRRPALRALILAGALALAAGFLLAALLDSDADEEGPALTKDSHAVVAIDPATNGITDVASVGARPGPLAFEPKSRSLWVANVDDRTVTRIDTRPLQVGRTVGVGATPGGLATADGAVWVATANRAKPFVTLSKIDPGFNALAGSVNIAAAREGTADVTRSGDRLLVAPLLGLLTEVDPRTGAVARPGVEPGGLAPSAVAAGEGSIWVADALGNTVSRIDAHSGAAEAIPVGNGPAGVAVGEGSVWVTLALDGSVIRIDPETGAVRDTVPVGRRPTGVAIGGGAVWTANSGDGTVSRVDPSSGRVTAEIRVGASPQDLAVGGGRVWVSARPRVLPEPTRPAATLRVAAGPQSGPEAFSLDPALGYWFLSWQVQQATCAKLLNYPDEPGQAGIRLRPEVAASAPTRSADGLTYTFRIRRGYRFSPPSNEPVMARNFKYAIERSYNPRLRGPVSNFPIPIAGVREFTSGRAPHISGVRALGDTLTIRLTRRLDDLPTWMGMPFFCAIPMGTPIDPHGVRAIPSAGPYYIASEDPGEGLVLRRNPNYEGPRPRRSAEIRISVPVAPKEAIARVEAGSADFATDAITPPSARRLAARHSASRYRIDPLLATDFVLFNTSRDVFSSFRLRRAVNLAIDRRALARAGGMIDGLPARPTDQYLPPGMPGFEDVDVYPLEPNLRKARALAGARRRAVRLYTPKLDFTEQLAEIVKSNLEAIGMDVDIRTFTSFDVFQPPNEPWDIALISWYADRPDPIDYLQHFDSRLIQPEGPNLGRFSDPDYDRRLDAANRLTGAERYIAFGRLDAHVIRTGAPVAAFSNEAQHSFFSDRVGCQIHNPVWGIDLAALCIREEE